METKKHLRLLLHCEGGSPPYLTPHLMGKYFAPDNSLVSQHLSLGIQIRECCVVPLYEKKVKKSKKKKESKGTADKDDQKLDIHNSKPTGYTFSGCSLPKHLLIPNNYEIISVPSFDLIDQYKTANNIKNKITTIPQSTTKEAILCTLNGYQKISSDLFVDVIKDLEANSHVGLYDQATNPTNNGSSNWKKKNQQSVERTKLWAENYFTKSKQFKCNPQTKFWIPIVGGNDIDSRVNATCVAENYMSGEYSDKVEGVAFVGFHHIESSDLRKKMIQTCLMKVKGLRSAVLATKGLIQIMDAGLSGVDVIGSDLPIILARSSKALALNLRGWRNIKLDSDIDETNG